MQCVILSGCFFFLFTALDCPTNTVYDPCFSGCPATCSSAANTLSCNTTCQETCRCADGLVLDDGVCVDPSQCGCTLANDIYLQVIKGDALSHFMPFPLCSLPQVNVLFLFILKPVHACSMSLSFVRHSKQLVC